MARTRVRWGRLGVLAAALFAALNVAAAAAGAGDTVPDGDRATLAAPQDVGALEPHVVEPGETLWAIAARLAGPQADPRPVMDRIAAENGLTGRVLQAGETILLPPSA